MTVKLVIFDCDGVLVDSEPATLRIIADDLAMRGLSLTDHDMHAFFVGGTMTNAVIKAQKMGANLPPDWLPLISEKMLARLRDGVAVFADVVAFVDALHDAGITTAIASNGPLKKMAITLTPSGLLQRFGDRIYSGHHYPPKPAPDMIIKAMQAANVTAAQTVFIDDSASGAKAGIAAGVKTFGFDPSGTFAHIGDLPVTRVTSMREIAGLIGVKLS